MKRRFKVYASNHKRPIKAWSSDTIVDVQAILEDIAEKYTTSQPVSGDWDTELDHELEEIAEALNVSEESAKALMINELGFTELDFQ